MHEEDARGSSRIGEREEMPYFMSWKWKGEEKLAFLGGFVLGGTSWEQRQRIGKFRSFSGCEKSPSTES
ncbi:unnamed protein product [Sphagnum tenellum]